MVVYVVWQGRRPGIYQTWDQCKDQIDWFPWAQFKKYRTQQEAERAFEMGYRQGISAPKLIWPPECVWHIAVDAACRGNPWILEYQWVMIGSDRISCTQLFYRGPYEQGSTNLGEFIALVVALRYVHKHPWLTIYSDSLTAMAWVRDRQVRTTLDLSQINPVVRQQVQECVTWLRDHSSHHRSIKKWNTQERWECPADFGRK